VKAAEQRIERLERQLSSLSEKVNGGGPRFDALYAEFEQRFRGTFDEVTEKVRGYLTDVHRLLGEVDNPTNPGSIPSMRLAMPSRPSSIASAKKARIRQRRCLGSVPGPSNLYSILATLKGRPAEVAGPPSTPTRTTLWLLSRASSRA
jgi:hypothetical protein